MASDVFIASNQGNYFTALSYSYAGNQYMFLPVVDSFFGGLFIKAWKSADGGATWASIAQLAVSNFTSSPVSPCLIGTKLYLWYVVSGFTRGVAYFDFTTDAFTTVTTTGSPATGFSRILTGLAATELFTVYSGGSLGASVVIARYLSNAFSVIGTLAPNSPYTNSQPQGAIQGSSGTLHILYEATKQASAIGPSDLGYVNLTSGSISGNIGSNIIYANYSDSFLVPDSGIGLGPPLQVGATIYFSFYDPFAQALKLLSFPDSSSPSFTFTTIDPAWPITAGGVSDEPGTGSWSNFLGYYNGELYCFYVNTWSTVGSGYSGDSTLYYRKSTDGGATWSARLAIIIHHDPNDGTPFKILYPGAVQFVGAPPSPVTTVLVSYNQSEADSGGHFGPNGRFAFPFVLSARSRIGRGHSAPAYGSAVR